MTASRPPADAGQSPEHSAADEPNALAALPGSGWRLVFGSLFTPSWSLALLLFVGLFLPSYEGCSGKVVHPYQIVTSDDATLGSLYVCYLVVWPFLFGLLVAVGVTRIAWRRNPERARSLWWAFAGLIIMHAALVAVHVAETPPGLENVSNWDGKDVLLFGCWFGVTLLLLALVPLTAIRCRTWFHAAVWLQLALAISAAVCLSYIVPAAFFARRLLVGGKLAVAASVFLIVATVVLRLDGYRVLTSRPGDSPLQLSLKSMLLLMTIGGLACAWVGVYVFLQT